MPNGNPKQQQPLKQLIMDMIVPAKANPHMRIPII